MRNNKKVTHLLGDGKNRQEQRFVAVRTVGNFQQGQIYRVLFNGVNAAITQYGPQLKALDGRITFLLPSQQVVFNQKEIERSLYRFQNNWWIKLRAQLLGIRVQLSYEDQDDFEMAFSDKRKPVYVPKEMAYEQIEL